MCGILGRINKNTKIDQNLFEKQLTAIHSRGPDAYGTFFNNNIALGQRRLSIVDLSENGRQPMFNEDKTIAIIFNGEIYNYKEVQSKLTGKHILRSNSDTEILLHAYEDFGEDIVKLIEGMFSLCIYDSKKEKLFLARDHFGKKPFYYFLDNDTFVFGSEIKALLADPTLKSKLSLDTLSIEKFLYYGYIPSPHCVFSEIKKLPPTTSAVFDIKDFKLTINEPYWNPESIRSINTVNINDIVAETSKLLDMSVEKRLMSDVPLGIFLSGGIDSSLIATFLSEKTKNLNSFTVCYPDIPNIDESAYAKQVADMCGFNYNLVPFTSPDVLPNFTEIYDYLDEPLADAAVVPLYFISKNAKKTITVVLSGDGGDELFAGYHKYKAQQFIENNKGLGLPAKIVDNVPFVPAHIKKMLELYSEPFYVRQFMFGSGSLMKNEVASLLKNSLDMPKVFEDARIYYDKIKNLNPEIDSITCATYLDWKLQLPDWYLVKSDRAAMANSQEMRNPFLDKALAEFALSIPGNIKIFNGSTKYILKRLAKTKFPASFVDRPKKGFGVPLDKWIRNELNDLFKQYLFTNNELFNLDFIRKLYEDHINGVADNQFKLLRIFSVNYFLKKYYE